MPRQASGAYQAPANTAAVSNQTISSTKYNSLTGDLGTEITNSLDRQGRGGMQADLNLGGFKGTNAGNPTGSTDLVTLGYADANYESSSALVPTSTFKGNNSGAAAAATATITVTIASPGVVTWNAHGRAADDPVYFTTTGALPTGLSVDVIYYVVGASITTNTFQVSATKGGAAINTSGSQSGTHTGVAPAEAVPQEITFAAFKKVMQQEPVNAQTGTSYTVTFNDIYKLTTFSNSSAVAVTLPQAIGNFGAGVWLDFKNDGVGLVTITPTTSTIDGAATLILPKGWGLRVVSDGTNYRIVGMNPTIGRVLLNTVTVSNAAEIADTTSLTSLFKKYEIEIVNLVPVTNAVEMKMELRSAGSYQTSSYKGAGIGYRGGAESLGATAYIQLTAAAAVANADPGLCGNITINEPSSTTKKKHVLGQVTLNAVTFNVASYSFGAWWNGGNGAITGFRIYASSGNVTGALRIYGMN